MTNNELTELLEEAARRLRETPALPGTVKSEELGMTTSKLSSKIGVLEKARGSPEDYAQSTKRHIVTVRRWCREGKLVARKVGGDRQIDLKASERALFLKFGNGIRLVGGGCEKNRICPTRLLGFSDSPMKLLLPLILAIALTIPTLQAQQSELDRVTANREKIKALVLPDFILEGVPLREALDKLNRAGIAADPEKDAKKRGVNIVLKMGQNDSGTEKVTLNMKTPTMESAFLEIARQSNLLVIAEPYCIALVPKTQSVPAEKLISEAKQ
jgi:hypothetical protein